MVGRRWRSRRGTDLTKRTGVHPVEEVGYGSPCFIQFGCMDFSQKSELGKRCVLHSRPRLETRAPALCTHWPGSFGTCRRGWSTWWGVFPVTLLGSPEAPVLVLSKFRSPRDLESEISAFRAEFSARPVIAAQTPRVGRLVGVGTEPEDEDDWQFDVFGLMVRGGHNTARSVHSHCDLREQQPRGRWASSLRKRPQNVVSMKLDSVDAHQRCKWCGGAHSGSTTRIGF